MYGVQQNQKDLMSRTSLVSWRIFKISQQELSLLVTQLHLMPTYQLWHVFLCEKSLHARFLVWWRPSVVHVHWLTHYQIAVLVPSAACWLPETWLALNWKVMPQVLVGLFWIVSVHPYWRYTWWALKIAGSSPRLKISLIKISHLLWPTALQIAPDRWNVSGELVVIRSFAAIIISRS